MSVNLKLTSEKILEVNSDSDVMRIKFVSTKARPNLNDCFFTSDFLNSRGKDLVHPHPMPLTIDYDDYKNMPRGHGMTMNGELMAMPIGYMTNSYVEQDENGLHQLVNEAVVWKNRFPSIANCIYQLHLQDRLRFSIECMVSDYDFTDEGIRIPKIEGAKFIGVAIVDDPAEPSAKSLMIASLEDLKSEVKNSGLNISNATTSGGVEMDEKIQELEDKIAELNQVLETKDVEINSLKEDNEKLQSEIAQLQEVKVDNETKNEAIISLNSAIDELKVEIESLQPIKDEYQRMQDEIKEKELAEKREVLKQYVLNSKVVTNEELEANEELKTAIHELNQAFVKEMIADKIVEQAKSLEVNSKDDDVTITLSVKDTNLLPEDRRSKLYRSVDN